MLFSDGYTHEHIQTKKNQFKNLKTSWVVAHDFNPPALERQRQGNLCEFQASLVNAKTARAVKHRNTVSKQTNEKQNKEKTKPKQTLKNIKGTMSWIHFMSLNIALFLLLMFLYFAVLVIFMSYMRSIGRRN